MTDTQTTLPIVRPPDSQMMTYSELRYVFKEWPVWMIDRLAWELHEEEELGYY